MSPFSDEGRNTVKRTDKFKEHVLLVVIGVGLFWALFNMKRYLICLAQE